MHPIKNEDHNYASVSAALEERLSAFNETAIGPLRKRRLALSVHDDHAMLVGGLAGEIFWNALYVVSLWVREDHRREGYGSRLLEAAEDAGRRAQCDVAYLSTFTFQAPAFYEKNGYAIFGELTGVPPGASRQWFRKDLSRISP